MYLLGWGTEKNIQHATTWFKKAKALGIKGAERKLSQIQQKYHLKTPTQKQHNTLLSTVQRNDLADAKWQLKTLPLANHKAPLVAIAAKHNNIKMCQLLLQANAPIDIKDKQGNSAIIYAVLHSNLALIKMLLQHSANVNIQTHSGDAPLHIASIKNNVTVFELLLRHKANPNQRNHQGNSATDLNLQKKQKRILTLLGYQATSPLRQQVRYIQQRLDTQKTLSPLSQSIQLKNTALTRELLNKTKVLNTLDTEGLLPITRAAKLGDNPTITLLLNNGANIHQYDASGLSAIHYAIRQHHFSTLKHLVTLGANIDQPTLSSTSPLHLAAEHAHFTITKWLLNKGADANKLNKVGFTPLMSALVSYKNPKIPLLLLPQTKILTASHKEHMTALHLAASANTYPVEAYA